MVGGGEVITGAFKARNCIKANGRAMNFPRAIEIQTRSRAGEWNARHATAPPGPHRDCKIPLGFYRVDRCYVYIYIEYIHVFISPLFSRYIYT